MMRTWLPQVRVGSVFLLAIGLLLAQEMHTVAQDRAEPEPQDGSSVFALPEWAEPRSPASNAPTPRSGSPEAFRTNDDGTPTPPPIPIVGLEWLIAMGVGYGLWKLRATGTSPSPDS